MVSSGETVKIVFTHVHCTQVQVECNFIILIKNFEFIKLSNRFFNKKDLKENFKKKFRKTSYNGLEVEVGL
jgi:hypothetical protein